MLLDGFQHVAVLTGDTDRLLLFYAEIFGATDAVEVVAEKEMRMTVLYVGPNAELNIFEVKGNQEHMHQTPMLGRGRLDHLAVRASSIHSFEEIRDRLVAADATDGFVTDFGPILSVFFRDPDGLECEICVANPDAEPGVYNPPGTPAPRYHGPGAG